jgi:hypothetical protein
MGWFSCIKMFHQVNWKTTLPLVKIKVFFWKVERTSTSGSKWLTIYLHISAMPYIVSSILFTYISSVWEVKQCLTSSARSYYQKHISANSVIYLHHPPPSLLMCKKWDEFFLAFMCMVSDGRKKWIRMNEFQKHTC